MKISLSWERIYKQIQITRMEFWKIGKQVGNYKEIPMQRIRKARRTTRI